MIACTCGWNVNSFLNCLKSKIFFFSVREISRKRVSLLMKLAVRVPMYHKVIPTSTRKALSYPGYALKVFSREAGKNTWTARMVGFGVRKSFELMRF